MSRVLKVGKLDSDVLEELVIKKIKFKRPEVRTGAGIGEDCAVVDFGDYDCVISTDPITASVKDIGRLSVHISCNDIASNGVEPIAITLCVLLPEGTTYEEVSVMGDQAEAAAESVGVQIVGGHTEVTGAVKQPVIVSTAFGRALKENFQDAAQMAPGDVLIVTKKAALEGTGILCTEREEALRSVLTDEELARGKDMLSQVSVVREGIIAGGIGTHGMHDVTEGGLLGAVWEMCEIAHLGCEIDEEKLPVDELTRRVASFFGADWQRMISSGCMLIAASPENGAEIADKVRAAGIDACVIGTVKEKGYGRMIRRADGKCEEIAPPAADEIYRALGEQRTGD